MMLSNIVLLAFVAVASADVSSLPYIYNKPNVQYQQKPNIPQSSPTFQAPSYQGPSNQYLSPLPAPSFSSNSYNQPKPPRTYLSPISAPAQAPIQSYSAPAPVQSYSSYSAPAPVQSYSAPSSFQSLPLSAPAPIQSFSPPAPTSIQSQFSDISNDVFDIDMRSAIEDILSKEERRNSPQQFVTVFMENPIPSIDVAQFVHSKPSAPVQFSAPSAQFSAQSYSSAPTQIQIQAPAPGQGPVQYRIPAPTGSQPIQIKVNVPHPVYGPPRF